MNSKSILFIGRLSPGGAEHQMVILASLLKQEGYDVSYLCVGGSDFYLEDLNQSAIRLFRINENRLASFFRISILRTAIIIHKLLVAYRFDTVISFLGNCNFYNCISANRHSTKHKAITGIRNNRDSHFLSRRERFFSRFEKYASYKVSNSKSAQARYAQLFPSLAPKLKTIYNIVILPPITAPYTHKKDGKIHIIVPASYREVKNPMRLLEAVAHLAQEEKDHLCIDWYGSIKAGPALYEQMSHFINNHYLGTTVFLHDATRSIAERINQADVVGLFSLSEGLPNAICEGMMLGKPIIMTRVSDFDVLVDANNGFLCDAEKPQSISEALSAVVHLSFEELIAMGNQSKIKATALFSADVVIKQWEAII